MRMLFVLANIVNRKTNLAKKKEKMENYQFA